MDKSIRTLAKKAGYIAPSLVFALRRIGRFFSPIKRLSSRTLRSLFGSEAVLEEDIARTLASRGLTKAEPWHVYSSELAFLNDLQRNRAGGYYRGPLIEVGTAPSRELVLPHVVSHEIEHAWTLPRKELVSDVPYKPTLGKAPFYEQLADMASPRITGGSYTQSSQQISTELLRDYPSALTGPIPPHELRKALEQGLYQHTNIEPFYGTPGEALAEEGVKYMDELLRAAKPGPEGYELTLDDLLDVYRRWFTQETPDVARMAADATLIRHIPRMVHKAERLNPFMTSAQRKDIINRIREFLSSSEASRMGYTELKERLLDEIAEEILKTHNPRGILDWRDELGFGPKPSLRERIAEKILGARGRGNISDEEARNMAKEFIKQLFDWDAGKIAEDYIVHREGISRFYQLYPEEAFTIGQPQSIFPEEIREILR